MGGPEHLENEINEINLRIPFFGSVAKYLFGSFYVPASPQQFLEGPADTAKVPA